MNDQAKNANLYLIILIVLAMIAFAGAVWWARGGYSNTSISNFNDCRQAGGVIAESYPEQCFINGQGFTNIQ